MESLNAYKEPIPSIREGEWMIQLCARKYKGLEVRFAAAETTMNEYERSLFRILVGHYVHSIRKEL